MTEPKTVLVVDDDPSVCHLFSAMLKAHGFEVVAEEDGHKALGLLRDGGFDVVVLDLVMPHIDGLSMIAEIREYDAALPILVVTGYGSAETTVAAMRCGATDFVTKPVDDAAFLDLRVRRAWDLEHARRLANTDGLTGIYNHRYLQERLRSEIDRAERYSRPLSVIMADLDHFKHFNDAYGHPRGDEVLIEVAHTLRRLSRATDVVARYGGEEFTLILPETPASEARVLAERARECIAAFCLTADAEHPVTLSAGIAAHHAGMTKEELIEAADCALYRAKREGRDRVFLAEPVLEVRKLPPAGAMTGLTVT